MLVHSGEPRQYDSREDESGAIALRAMHDGYASRFGILHERVLLLSKDGSRLEGEDIFLDADGEPRVRGTRDEFKYGEPQVQEIEVKDIISEAKIRKLEADYLEIAKSGSAVGLP